MIHRVTELHQNQLGNYSAYTFMADCQSPLELFEKLHDDGIFLFYSVPVGAFTRRRGTLSQGRIGVHRFMMQVALEDAFGLFRFV